MYEQLTFQEVVETANQEVIHRDMQTLELMRHDLSESRETQVHTFPSGIRAMIFKKYARETCRLRISKIDRSLDVVSRIESRLEALSNGEIDFETYVAVREGVLIMGGLQHHFKMHHTSLLRGDLIESS